MMQHRGPTIDASAHHAPYPRRNLDKLYCQSLTYLCAIGALPRRPNNNNNSSDVAVADDVDAPSVATAAATTVTCCVPCAYKICNFDISLDSDFTKRIPNQRPEQCPRSHSSYNAGDGETDSRDGTMGYHRGMNVLTVGDGDFTFSLAVARLVIGDTNNDCHTTSRGMVVATSYENSDTLRKVYPDFDKTLDSLTCHGENIVTVAYNVDATRLDETLPEHLQRGRVKFHRICWNL